MRWTAVGGGELVRVDLRADAVDRTGVVAVGDGGAACLDRPQGLEGLRYDRRWVEDDLRGELVNV